MTEYQEVVENDSFSYSGKFDYEELFRLIERTYHKMGYTKRIFSNFREI